MKKGISGIEIRKNSDGNYTHVAVSFGPHYYVVIQSQKQGGATFLLGATHHGFTADASRLNGELERIIDEVRRAHPENSDDQGPS